MRFEAINEKAKQTKASFLDLNDAWLEQSQSKSYQAGKVMNKSCC